MNRVSRQQTSRHVKGRIPAPIAQEPVPAAAQLQQINWANAAHSIGRTASTEPRNPFVVPKPMPGVIPEGRRIACDAQIGEAYSFAGAYGGPGGYGMVADTPAFQGYPYLSLLTQIPEYRRPAEVIAKEMTRKWLKLQCTGDNEDKSDKLRDIEAELKRLGAQAAFRKAAEQDGFFGRSQIYLDMGNTDDQDELKIPLAVKPSKIGIGSLKRLTVIEPIWTYPNYYNSNDPLQPDYFKPTTWFVQGTEIHSSRLLTFVSRELPDLLKPAYVFGGLSLSQMSEAYVNNWLRTRQSVSDLIHSFSVSGIKTNLASMTNAQGSSLLDQRAQFFNVVRDNRGLMMIDKDTEEFFNVSVPLGSLDKLQAQSQEHQAAVTGIPLVKLLGITPSGLNASSDGEIRCFYDWVEAQQESLFTPQMSRLLEIVQLSLFGEIDPEIGFRWEPLWSLDESSLANVRKTEADTAAVWLDKGVISGQEARTVLASQEDSPYASLDLTDDLPEPPAGPDDQQNQFGEQPGHEEIGGGIYPLKD